MFERLKRALSGPPSEPAAPVVPSEPGRLDWMTRTTPYRFRTWLADPSQRDAVSGILKLLIDRELTVESRKGTADHPIVKLAETDGRELRGEPITVPRSALGALEEGEFLVDDLTGCEAFDASNRLEPRAGTLIALGDCREKNQQLASAWSAYKDALTRVRPGK